MCVCVCSPPTLSVSSTPPDLTHTAYTYCLWCRFGPVIDAGLLCEMKCCVWECCQSYCRRVSHQIVALFLPFMDSIPPQSHPGSKNRLDFFTWPPSLQVRWIWFGLKQQPQKKTKSDPGRSSKSKWKLHIDVTLKWVNWLRVLYIYRPATFSVTTAAANLSQ